jgi:hypothetical protein
LVATANKMNIGVSNIMQDEPPELPDELDLKESF